MKPEDYTIRFYRKWQKPDNLVEFSISYKESDLTVFAEKDLSDIALSLLVNFRKAIEEIIKNHPLFKTSLKPIHLETKNPYIRDMIRFSTQANVGPMAGVAGAVAQCVGESLLGFSKELIIENGGDIFINSSRERVLMIYAGEESPFKDKLKIKLRGNDRPYGVCTSSKSIGHSLNFGNTDATVIIAESAISADIFATAISNKVKSVDDLENTVNYAKGIDCIKGGIIIIGEKAAAWGEIEFV